MMFAWTGPTGNYVECGAEITGFRAIKEHKPFGFRGFVRRQKCNNPKYCFDRVDASHQPLIQTNWKDNKLQ